MCKNQPSQVVCNSQCAGCHLLQCSVVPQPGWICKLLLLARALLCRAPLSWDGHRRVRLRGGLEPPAKGIGRAICIQPLSVFSSANYSSSLPSTLLTHDVFQSTDSSICSVSKSFMVCQMAVKGGVKLHHLQLTWDTLCVPCAYADPE